MRSLDLVGGNRTYDPNANSLSHYPLDDHIVSIKAAAMGFNF